MNKKTASAFTLNRVTDAASPTATDSVTVRFELSGDLDFDTVPAVLEEISRQIDGCPDVTLDLSGVDNANSAALALLVECRSRAFASDRKLAFTNLPVSVIKIAEVCEVTNIL